jgi:hypothetical protein
MVPAPSLVRLHQDPEEPMPYTSDSALVRELPAAAVKTLIELAGPGSGSPLAIVELRQIGGALSRTTPGHGAVAGIDGQFVLFSVGMALDADMEAFMLGHASHIKAGLADWLGDGYYLNFAEEAVELAGTYGATTYERLQAVKARINPENAIRANHAI